ncbi:MAG: hypothetical protein ACM3ZU_08270 [Bacteroidota bacterium]
MSVGIGSPSGIKGRFMRKDFYTMGSLPTRDGSTLGVVARVSHQYTPSEDKMYFVQIVIAPSAEHRSEEVGALDPDECRSMIQALDCLTADSERLRGETLEYAEIDFCTSNRMLVGFSQTGKRQLGYLYVHEDSLYGKAYFDVSGFRQLQALLSSALNTLESLGASQTD